MCPNEFGVSYIKNKEVRFKQLLHEFHFKSYEDYEIIEKVFMELIKQLKNPCTINQRYLIKRIAEINGIENGFTGVIKISDRMKTLLEKLLTYAPDANTVNDE